MIPEYDSLAFASASVRVRAQRHQVLAANLVNADTPAFAARDLDFPKELQRALGGSAQPSLSATHHRHITTMRLGADRDLLYRVPAQPAVDGNTVDPDVERAHFAANTMGTELAMMTLASALRSRQTAWSGQA